MGDCDIFLKNHLNWIKQNLKIYLKAKIKAGTN